MESYNKRQGCFRIDGEIWVVAERLDVGKDLLLKGWAICVIEDSTKHA